MTKAQITKEAHEYLQQHLAFIEEEKNQVCDTHYANEPEKRGDFKEFLENYISQINQFVQTASITEDPSTPLPFSTIGSIIEVEDVEDKEIIHFYIVSPFSENKVAHAEEDSASYLSPIGKALLLKSVGETVTAQTPAGVLEYKVKSFRFP